MFSSMSDCERPSQFKLGGFTKRRVRKRLSGMGMFEMFASFGRPLKPKPQTLNKPNP